MKKGIFPKNQPAVKIKEPKTGKRIPKFLTEMEIEHIRIAAILFGYKRPMELFEKKVPDSQGVKALTRWGTGTFLANSDRYCSSFNHQLSNT